MSTIKCICGCSDLTVQVAASLTNLELDSSKIAPFDIVKFLSTNKTKITAQKISYIKCNSCNAVYQKEALAKLLTPSCKICGLSQKVDANGACNSCNIKLKGVTDFLEIHDIIEKIRSQKTVTGTVVPPVQKPPVQKPPVQAPVIVQAPPVVVQAPPVVNTTLADIAKSAEAQTDNIVGAIQYSEIDDNWN